MELQFLYLELDKIVFFKKSEIKSMCFFTFLNILILQIRRSL